MPRERARKGEGAQHKGLGQAVRAAQRVRAVSAGGSGLPPAPLQADPAGPAPRSAESAGGDGAHAVRSRSSLCSDASVTLQLSTVYRFSQSHIFTHSESYLTSYYSNYVNGKCKRVVYFLHARLNLF